MKVRLYTRVDKTENHPLRYADVEDLLPEPGGKIVGGTVLVPWYRSVRGASLRLLP